MQVSPHALPLVHRLQHRVCASSVGAWQGDAACANALGDSADGGCASAGQASCINMIAANRRRMRSLPCAV